MEKHEFELVNSDYKIDEEFLKVMNEAGYIHGTIINVEPRKITPRDDRPEFTMVDIYVKDIKGRRFKKSYSVDFIRKYLNQLNITVIDLAGKQVLFKQRDEFKNISALTFIAVKELDDGSGVYPIQVSYINEPKDDTQRWKSLGLL